VYPENPLHLNERLTIQQGIFLCPGDIGVSFSENIQAMDGWDSSDNVVKIKLDLGSDQVAEFALMLKRMNVSSSVSGWTSRWSHTRWSCQPDP
jgi:hypothetical protein